jgi:hypothetical protein
MSLAHGTSESPSARTARVSGPRYCWLRYISKKTDTGPQNVVALWSGAVINDEAPGQRTKFSARCPGRDTPRRLVEPDPTPSHEGGGAFFVASPGLQRTWSDPWRPGWGRRPRKRDRAPSGEQSRDTVRTLGGASAWRRETEPAAASLGAPTRPVRTDVRSVRAPDPGPGGPRTRSLVRAGRRSRAGREGGLRRPARGQAATPNPRFTDRACIAGPAGDAGPQTPEGIRDPRVPSPLYTPSGRSLWGDRIGGNPTLSRAPQDFTTGRPAATGFRLGALVFCA